LFLFSVGGFVGGDLFSLSRFCVAMACFVSPFSLLTCWKL
jgi:hypothetical protein